MKRIERDPIPCHYSEDNFRHLEASLLRADFTERHEDNPGFNWSAFWGAVIGTSVSLVFWWCSISLYLWIKGW